MVSLVRISVKQFLVFGRIGSKIHFLYFQQTPQELCIPETKANSSDLDLGNVIPGHFLEIKKSFGNKGFLDLEGFSL
jgi:hypothetical protein